ncbi:pteridine reductase [Aurantivibrio infirmus]
MNNETNENTQSTEGTRKVALVTGAARRIGAEITQHLHTNGFNLVIHYNRSESDAKKLCNQLNSIRKNSAITICADLCKVDTLKALADEAKQHWSRLDVLVNNASSFYATPIGSITVDHWQDLMGSNLQAPLFLSQACAAYLGETQGCIINIADIHGERPLSDHPVYCIAKAGNIMLTKSLAKDLAPKVRVNGISPGAILWPEDSAELENETKASITKKIALKKIGEPSDIARTINFLVSDAPYITGQIIAVDGGRNLVS